MSIQENMNLFSESFHINNLSEDMSKTKILVTKSTRTTVETTEIQVNDETMKQSRDSRKGVIRVFRAVQFHGTFKYKKCALKYPYTSEF